LFRGAFEPPDHHVSGGQPAACHFSAGEFALLEKSIDRVGGDAKHLGGRLDIKDAGGSCGKQGEGRGRKRKVFGTGREGDIIMEMKKIQDELIDEIRQRVNFITSDCDTFLAAKGLVDKRQIDTSIATGQLVAIPQKKSHIQKWETGGGNFLMALGLFAVLNFLAKVHRHLTDPDAFIAQNDREIVNETIKGLKKDPKLKVILEGKNTRWLPPRVGDVNEKESFIKLVDALPNKIDLGIPDDKGESAGEIWNSLRNSLAHMAWPKSPLGAYSTFPESTTMRELRWMIDSGQKSFYKYQDCLVYNSDKLNIDVYKIAEWICTKIEKGIFSNANIGGTLKWMRE
jgi:hypothetical protein